MGPAPRHQWEQWLRRHLAEYDMPEHLDTVTVWAVASMAATYGDWDDWGGITVSVQTLRDQLRVKKSRVRLALAWLNDTGVMLVEVKHGRGTATRRQLAVPGPITGASATVDGSAWGPVKAVDNCPPSVNDGTQLANDGTQTADNGTPQGGPRPNQGRSPDHPRAREIVRSATDASDDETTQVLGKIKTSNPRIRNLGAYVRTLAESGDLGNLLDDLRADDRRTAVRAKVDDLRTKPPCRHGDPGGDQPHPVSGEPLCPRCRAEGRKPA